jgi:hypothetical protein
MVYCPKCGKELSADAMFCDRCGKKMDEPVSSSEAQWGRRFENRFESRFQRYDHGPDYLDGVGFGVFLIAVAWVYLKFPWIWMEVTAWFRGWVNGPTMLPVILAEPVVLFFIVMSGWGLIEGAVRIISGRVIKGVGNVVSALGGLAIAYMTRLYSQGVISGTDILPFFIIIVGASVVLSTIVSSIAGSFSPRRD